MDHHSRLQIMIFDIASRQAGGSRRLDGYMKDARKSACLVMLNEEEDANGPSRLSAVLRELVEQLL